MGTSNHFNFYWRKTVDWWLLPTLKKNRFSRSFFPDQSVIVLFGFIKHGLGNPGTSHGGFNGKIIWVNFRCGVQSILKSEHFFSSFLCLKIVDVLGMMSYVTWCNLYGAEVVDHRYYSRYYPETKFMDFSQYLCWKIPQWKGPTMCKIEPSILYSYPLIV